LRSELLLGGDVFATCPRPNVCPHIPGCTSQGQQFEGPKPDCDIGSGILQPVVTALSFQRVRTRTIERNLRIVSLSRIDIHIQAVVSELWKLKTKVIFLVGLDGAHCSYAKVQLSGEQVLANIFRANRETTARGQPTPFKTKSVKPGFGPINESVPLNI